jgi:hypothetical protein
MEDLDSRHHIHLTSQAQPSSKMGSLSQPCQCFWLPFPVAYRALRRRRCEAATPGNRSIACTGSSFGCFLSFQIPPSVCGILENIPSILQSPNRTDRVDRRAHGRERSGQPQHVPQWHRANQRSEPQGFGSGKQLQALRLHSGRIGMRPCAVPGLLPCACLCC